LLVIVFLTTAVPIIMGDGVSAILRERYIVAYQMSRGLPAVYDIKKIIGGYCKIFPALWLFPSACLLLPGGSLFVGILPPILLMSLLIIKLIEHTWLTFGFSKKTYWIMHASALALLSFSAIILHSALGY
ncbi:MAG: hypothetical protein IJW21_06405, partial [Clostridia bacterium]|nr:hypothetical protein [Clostridia bacterium]